MAAASLAGAAIRAERLSASSHAARSPLAAMPLPRAHAPSARRGLAPGLVAAASLALRPAGRPLAGSHRPSLPGASTRDDIICAAKRSPQRHRYAEGPATAGPLSYVSVLPDASDAWRLNAVAELIGAGAVGIIPTDTLYTFVCDIASKEAVERLYRIKKMDAKKPLSVLCRSFADIDEYTLGFPEGSQPGAPNVFRAVKQCLPGPYTFILPASKKLPKQCTNFTSRVVRYRKSVGVRLPSDPICGALLARLPRPLLCSSVRLPDDTTWMLDPVLMADEYGAVDDPGAVAFVVDGGKRAAEPSTIVEMMGRAPRVVRAGKGTQHPAEWEEEPEEEEGEEAEEEEDEEAEPEAAKGGRSKRR